ncbi:MAG: L-2-amino-thiazoline-4-carboxylic acid hydrolase [Clostridiales bacterium]|nr:L-2-amino-thiazoline-4-carboxylic acid hydrolase [Clostridiales bacterium]MDY2836064.1 L-2-amino-thiazoline-4-carboxylic acid hydrolase [Candidatus Aphodomonas sp.]
MKRAYAASQYAGPYERYCRENFPGEAEQIIQRAEAYYREFMKDTPDLGRNMMARNMLDWFTILSFYEASGRRLDGEALLTIKRRALERLKFVGKIVDGNRDKWPCRLFERAYVRYDRVQRAHQAKGEWLDSWRVEINPDRRTEGFCFHLIGCPIARHAKAHGYEALLPYLCRTDHFLAEMMHARLIRTRTEALGGDCCDYWYVGDKSPALENYKDLERI